MAETEVIVKYNGNIQQIANSLGGTAEILSRNCAILTIEENQIQNLYELTEIEDIELPKRLFVSATPNALNSVCIGGVNDDSYGLSGRNVIVAIIDSGIDYTHPTFLNSEGTTRILNIWDQTIEGVPPDGFTQGTEFSTEQINAALQSGEQLSTRDTVGHGTAVAAIAAGNRNDSAFLGVAYEADILAVKVGNKGNDFFAESTQIMRALKYCIDKAKAYQKPVVINMSFGMNSGSHRGDSLFERYIAEIGTEWKSNIVIPTGNEGAAGHHFSGTVSAYKTTDIDFFTASGINGFYLTLWKNFADSFTVELIFPDNSGSGIIGIESQRKTVRNNNFVLNVLYGQPVRYSVQQEIYFDIRATGNSLMSGQWRLRIRSTEIVDGNINIWLPTLEEVTSRTYFSGANIYDTITLPATADNVIRVSGYNNRIGSIANFSGKGNINTVLPFPDISAPAVDVLSARVGGGYDSFTGTSFAAPFVTGAVALIMQWGISDRNSPFLYGERIRAFLRLGANRSNTVKYPNPSFGYGTLCLNKTISFLERYTLGSDNLFMPIPNNSGGVNDE